MESLAFTVDKPEVIYDNSVAEVQADATRLVSLLHGIDPTLAIVSRAGTDHHCWTSDLLVLSANSVPHREAIEKMLWKAENTVRFKLEQLRYTFEETRIHNNHVWPIDCERETLAIRRVAFRRVSRFRWLSRLVVLVCVAGLVYALVYFL